MRFGRRSPDLLAALSLAVLGMAAALLPVEPWLRVILLGPLVLFIPGYVASCALLGERSVRVAERTVYAVALSAALVILTGVIVQLVFELDRVAWALALTVVTVVGVAVASRERRGAERPKATGPVPIVSPAAGVMLALACGLGVVAVVIASSGARTDRADARFTELELLASAASSGGQRVAIAVRNHEGIAVTYVIRVEQRGRGTRSRQIRVPSGGSWEASIPVGRISGASPVDVKLLREGTVYRAAILRNGSAP